MVGTARLATLRDGSCRTRALATRRPSLCSPRASAKPAGARLCSLRVGHSPQRWIGEYLYGTRPLTTGASALFESCYCLFTRV